MSDIDFYMEQLEGREAGKFKAEILEELKKREQGIASKHAIVDSVEPNSANTSCCSKTVKVISMQNPATNWWLALIAFLLFLMLCTNSNFN